MEKQQSLQKREKLIDGVVFAVLLAIATAVTFILFYRQTYGSPETGYHSDMKAYILEMQGLDSGYEFPYPIFFKLAAFFHLFIGSQPAVALATALLNSASMVITKLAMNHFILRKPEQAAPGRSWATGVLISLMTIALFFVSMLFPPEGIYLPGIYRTYLGVFTPNPFHNATYLAARPFSILAFLWFVKLLPVYEQGIGRKAGESGGAWWDYLLFSLFLLLATMTKPSFTLVLVSTAGLIMLYRMIRSGFRNFVPTVQFGLLFLPTFIDLLYQFRGVFVPDEGAEGGIGFCFGEVWVRYCGNLPLAVCLGVGFPLAVLVVNFRKCRKNTMLLFSWQLYAVGFAEAFFLYEKGFRKFDFNFCWGYICGMFFCHFTALLVLLQATLEETTLEAAGRCSPAEGVQTGGRGQSRRRPVLLVLQWLAFAWHLVCGIIYFAGIFRGAMYY